MNYISTKNLFFSLLNSGKICRKDIAIRFMAIDYYLCRKGNCKIYSKLIYLRETEQQVNIRINNFQLLINSFQSKLFDNKFPVLLNSNCILQDGAHRLSCCLYYNIEAIPFKITFSKLIGIDVNDSWFLRFFSERELDKINKYEKIIENKLNNEIFNYTSGS